jgi:hypothetical protein
MEIPMNKTLIALMTAASVFTFGYAQAADAAAKTASEASAPTKASHKKVAKHNKAKPSAKKVASAAAAAQ